MLFSIIVPVYKVEEYLHRCVQSLILQTYKDIEIILVDDGSPDSCPQICDEYAKQDNRVRVIHKENGGLSDARNVGLAIAQGEYVIFVDSDDYIEKNTCEAFSQYLNLGADILVGDANIVGQRNGFLLHNDDLKGKSVSGKEYLKRSLSANQAPMAAWLSIYKRDFLSQNNLCFKYGILHEDEQFSPRAFLVASKVVYTGINFYNYFIREDSITTKKDLRRNAHDLYETLFELEKIYLKIQDEQLKKLLLDSLVIKYLNMFFIGCLYKYKKDFLYKDFLKRNAYRKKTKLKVRLFRFSPRIYCMVNRLTK